MRRRSRIKIGERWVEPESQRPRVSYDKPWLTRWFEAVGDRAVTDGLTPLPSEYVIYEVNVYPERHPDGRVVGHVCCVTSYTEDGRYWAACAWQMNPAKPHAGFQPIVQPNWA